MAGAHGLGSLSEFSTDSLAALSLAKVIHSRLRDLDTMTEPLGGSP